MGAALNLESNKAERTVSTLKNFAKLLGRQRRIGRGQEEGHELRTVVIVGTGM